MSEQNIRDAGKMHLFTPGRDTAIDRLIEETERAIVNTRRFLDGLTSNERESRKYIRELTDQLESDLKELSRRNGARNTRR